MSEIGKLLSRLAKVKQTSRHSWIACCPKHEDKHPSMTILDCDDGRILIHCFAGCAPLEILESIGLMFEDLFPEPLKPAKSMRRPFPAADVLECLALESKIVLITAHRVEQGLPILMPDMTRLRTAVYRIEEGRELANG